MSVAVAIVAFALAGCSADNDETHYFKSVDGQSHAVNYYRLRVKGTTLLSSSRYYSGTYDAQAIDAYFNTMSQPPSGAIHPTPDTPTPGTSKPDTPKPGAGTNDPAQPTLDSQAKALAANKTETAKLDKVEPLQGGGSNQKLVLLLSSNSDAIAEGISAITRSNEIATTLTNIVGAHHFEASEQAASQADVGAIRGKVASDEATRILAKVADGTQPQTQAEMLKLANDLASLIAPHSAFKTLDDAADWLAANATEGMR